MPRYCFNLQVRPERIAEYVERHQSVWPEMQAALRATGWRNYSLFLRDDGLLVGYLETDDFAAAQRGMEETDVNARWQASMAEFFELPDDNRGRDRQRPREHVQQRVDGLLDSESRPGVMPGGRRERSAVNRLADAPGERFGVVRADQHGGSSDHFGEGAYG